MALSIIFESRLIIGDSWIDFKHIFPLINPLLYDPIWIQLNKSFLRLKLSFAFECHKPYNLQANLKGCMGIYH